MLLHQIRFQTCNTAVTQPSQQNMTITWPNIYCRQCRQFLLHPLSFIQQCAYKVCVDAEWYLSIGNKLSDNQDVNQAKQAP